MSIESEEQKPESGGVNQPNDTPPTPKHALNHQKLNECVMPGWMEFVLLAIGIVGFIVAMLLVR